MNFKTTYVLFGILGVMMGILALVLWLGPGGPGDTDYVLPSLHNPGNVVTGKDIQTVEVNRLKPTPEKMVFVREGDGWKMTEPYPLRVDKFLVDRLVGQIIDARKYEKADMSGKPKDYELDDPNATITLKSPQQQWTLNVGGERKGETTGAVYVTSSDIKEPMAIKRQEVDHLFKELNDFRSKDLVAGGGVGSFSNINYVKITDPKNKKDIVLKKSGDSLWRFDQPAYGAANYDDANPLTGQDAKKLGNVKALVGAIEGIKVGANEDFEPPSESDMAKYGLTDNAPETLKVEVKRKEGDDKPEITQVLLIGKKADHKPVEKKPDDKKPEEKKPEMYFARLEDEKAVAKIWADGVKPILDVVEKPDILRNRDLIVVDEAKTDAIDIKNPTGLIKLRRPDQATWKMIVEGVKDPRGADTQTVQDLIKALNEKAQVKSFPDPAKEKELGFDKPSAVTVSVWVDGLQKEKDKDKEKEKEKGEEKKEDKKEEKKEPEFKLKEEKPTVKLTFGNKDSEVVYVLREKGDDKAILAVPLKVKDLVDQPPLAYLDRRLPSFSEAADVTKLTIVRDGVTYELAKEPDKTPAVWKLNAPEDLKGRLADSFKVEGILDDLRGMRTSKLIAEKAPEADLKKFGLDPASYKAVVTILGDDKKPKDWVYLIGNKVDDKDSRYAKQGDKDLVFTVGPEVVKTLQADLPRMQIFSFDLAKVKGFKLEGWKKVEKRTVTLNLERTPDLNKPWVIKNDLGDFQLNIKEVDALLGELARLSADKFVVYKKGAKPEFELSKDDRGLQIDITVDGEKAPLTLTLGKLDADGKGYYAETSVLPGDVFIVPKEKFEKILTTGLKYFSK